MTRATVLSVLLTFVLVLEAAAGGGPETTLVVVNAGSAVSRRVANEYVALRDIPPSHIVELVGIPHLGTVTLPFFLSQIWAPIRAHVREHGLEGQVDLIAYSADFPYAVDFRTALDGHRPPQGTGRLASLTGVTYLIRQVRAGEEFWTWRANRYYRAPRAPTPAERGHLSRAVAAMRAGDFATAAEAFDTLLETHPGDGNVWYNHACCLARIEKGERALVALRKAVAMGFGNAKHASTDLDLVSIRGRPEFRDVLESMKTPGTGFLPAHGLRSTDDWSTATPRRDGPEDSVHRYVLSTQLAYTGPFGNSLPEVLASLRSAASSDGTHPDGTVYICKNGNVRSKAREPFFAPLMAALRRLGRKVELLENSKVPSGKADVIGAVVGTAGFSWGPSKPRMLPGAIAEHLTSYGGRFNSPGQTKLSEFLRAGAAGSSGTVQEPLSIHFKFPNPMIHAFYAEGCSLAEAFYQSLGGPYQLMVAGDGLARPFARFAEPRVDAPASPWRGTVTIGAGAEGCDLELWVDGRRVTEAGAPLTLDTTALEDGHHDVRVVAVARDAIGTRTTAHVEAVIRNGGREGSARLVGRSEVEYGETFVVRASGARKIRILRGARVVAEASGSRVEVDTTELGPGPVTIVPRLELKGDRVWRAEPIALDIVPPRPIAARPGKGPFEEGLSGERETSTEKSAFVVKSLGGRVFGAKLHEAVNGRGVTRLRFTGEMRAPRDGFYQLAVVGGGHATIEVAGERLCEKRPIGAQRYLPIALAKGWHPIEITYEPEGVPNLVVLLGGEQVLAPAEFRHEKR